MTNDAQGEPAKARSTRADRLQRDEYGALRRSIAMAMSRSGIGQRELSRRIGQTFAFTNKVLRGDRTLEFTELIDIASALDVDPIDLIREALSET